MPKMLWHYRRAETTEVLAEFEFYSLCEPNYTQPLSLIYSLKTYTHFRPSHVQCNPRPLTKYADSAPKAIRIFDVYLSIVRTRFLLPRFPSASDLLRTNVILHPSKCLLTYI